MKKLLIVIFFALPITAFAQRNSGFKIGYNIGWASSTKSSVIPNYNNMYDTTPLTKLLFGYSWNIKFTEKYSIQTDLTYNWKGSEQVLKNSFRKTLTQSEIPYYDIPAINNLQCLSLPITLNYFITPSLFAEFGGEFSLVAKNYYPFDYYELAVAMGVGYSTKFADLSVRYLHGLTPHQIRVRYSSDYTSYLEYTDKYRTFQISLTIPVFKHLKRK